MNGKLQAHHSATNGRWKLVPVLALAILLMATPLAVLSATPLPGLGTEIIRGQVFDEQGIPNGGVMVRLDGTSVSAPTDDYGRFTLPGSGLDGNQTLVFNKDGYMTAMVDYSLEDGGTLKLSVYMVEEELVPGAVEGIVRSFTGDPIEGVLVMLQLEDGSTRSVITNAAGHFAIHEIPPSHKPYSLMVEAPGHTTMDIEVVVRSGLTTNNDVTMTRETPMELIRGRVLDGRGFPLPDIAVRIEGSISEWTTDLDGRFSALLDGRLWTRNVSLTLNGYKDLWVPIEIPEPGLADVELDMSISDEGGAETIWVLVLNAGTDEPIDGATVALASTGRDWTTDSHGTVMITGADLEGWVELTATKSSHTYTTETFLLEDGGSGVVTLHITRTSNAVILEGVVLDISSGSPVMDALVMVDSGGIKWLTITDLDGSFLVHNLPPGVITVITVVAEGYHDEQVETILQEFEANRLTIGLETEGPVTTSVDGVVSVQEGAVKGARVTLWTNDGFMAVAHTDHIGGFSFQDVPVSSGWVYYRV
ncbi:MAG: carboxypeptidase regulatory-like domain-containing protein, partial [Candidatus Thermoplasmatota archaeon]|nr:carboxypeptidase regulatory-like domain-containing protein [Candidatus Thermoplasmatota archaeon]